MSTINILDSIWNSGLRSDEAYVFLPHKPLDGAWVETEAVNIWDLDELPEYPSSDRYFTPSVFTKPVRLTENLAPFTSLYADLDSDFDRAVLEAMPPSVLWETSPGSFQAVWFLDNPCPPDIGLDLNHRLAALIRADRGSWIGTKLLRIPGTVNWKRGGWQGRIIEDEPAITYPAERLHEDLPPLPKRALLDLETPPVPTLDEWHSLIEELWPQLDRRTKLMLTQRQISDRSLHLARIAASMATLNIDPQKIFGTLSRLPSNKFRTRPEVLWRSVVLTSVTDGN